MLELNRAVFFAKVRHGPFPGRLSQRQVDGMNALLDAWEKIGNDDPRHLAYVLATDFHETGARMQPVREGFSKSDKEARRKTANRRYGKPAGPYGHVYYGRGDVQLTWYDNYLRMGIILGIPLAENPDLALDPVISKLILIEGMTRGASGRGDFTNHALSDYFNDETDDPVGARRVVNGLDKAQLIAGYYAEFLTAIQAAISDEVTIPGDAIPAKRPTVKDETSWGGLIGTVGGAAASVKALLDGVDNAYALAALALVLAGGVLVFRGRLRILRETGE